MSAEPSEDVPVWAHVDWLSSGTRAGLVVAFMAAAMANAAGVGGGAIFVPLFNLLVGFSLKQSAALSQAMVTAGALASVLLNARRSRPGAPHLPLIDFDLASTIVPALLASLSAGVVLNVILPTWLIAFLLLAVLGVMSHQTAVKGVRMWLQESRQAESALAPHPGPYTAFLTPRTRRSAANRSTEDTDESDALVPKSPLGVFSALSPALGTAMRAAQGRVSGESRAFEIHAADVTPLAAETAFLASDAALSTPGTPFATPSAAPPPTAATRAPFPPATVFASPSSAVEGSARAAWGRGTEERRGETDAGAQRRLDEDFLGVEEEEEEEGGRGGEGGAGPVAESVGDMVRILSGDTDSGGMSLHRTLSFKERMRRLPVVQISWVSAVLGLYTVMSLLKKSVAPCGLVYWLILAAQVSIGLAATMYYSRRVGSAHGQQCDVEIASSGEHLSLSPGEIAKLVRVTVAAGLIAGIVGMGGGMVLSPVLMNMGVAPQVTAATSALVVLFSSSSAALQFVLMGHIPVWYALVFGGTCMVASLTGVLVVGKAVRRSGRPSIIVLMLALLIVLCTAVFLMSGTSRMIHDLRNGDVGFRSLCPA